MQLRKADRSQGSIRFEVRVRALSLPEIVLKRGAVAWGRFSEFVPQIVVLEPSITEGSLRFQFVGSSLSIYFDRDPTGTDYLDIVAPSTRRAAFESAAAMLRQPCGLWQVTPTRTSDGQTVFFEYTGFPIVAGGGEAADQILFFVQPIAEVHDGAIPRIVAAQQSTSWLWIDIGHGVPAAHDPERAQ